MRHGVDRANLRRRSDPNLNPGRGVPVLCHRIVYLCTYNTRAARADRDETLRAVRGKGFGSWVFLGGLFVRLYVAVR